MFQRPICKLICFRLSKMFIQTVWINWIVLEWFFCFDWRGCLFSVFRCFQKIINTCDSVDTAPCPSSFLCPVSRSQYGSRKAIVIRKNMNLSHMYDDLLKTSRNTTIISKQPSTSVKTRRWRERELAVPETN